MRNETGLRLEIQGDRGANLEAAPAMAHGKADARLAQAVNPAAEERSGFHLAGINPAGGGGEGFHLKSPRPFPQGVGREIANEGIPGFARHARTIVIRKKLFERFGLGEIEAAFAGHEKLAADGGLGVEESHVHALRKGDLGGAQSGRTSSDDRKRFHRRAQRNFAEFARGLARVSSADARVTSVEISA